MDTLPKQNIHPVQEKIYRFFLEIVRHWEPAVVLQEFKHVFLIPVTAGSSEILHAVYEIIFFNNEQEFRNTLKRTCYILINNWWVAREYHAIQKLVQLFAEIKSDRSSLSASLPLNTLNQWLQNFVNSKDYQDLKLFSALFENREKSAWSHRYTAYLLASQYVDLKNPIEQRETAKELAKHLREKFKRDLALFTAHSQSAVVKDGSPKNPTQLGDEALNLIKKIVAKRGLFSYSNLANIFLEQNYDVSYQLFKANLQKYLFYSFDLQNQGFLKTLQIELSKKIEHLYENYHAEILTNEILLRTCNYVIEFLTIDAHQKPALIFVLLVSQGATLYLAIFLLRIILISPHSRAHLEARIAHLIRYYEKMPVEDCWGVIHFLEVLNILFTIYTEDVEYNLVNVKNDTNDAQDIDDLDAYRIFSQLKSQLNLKGANLSGTDLHGADLNSVNLHSANLSNADLSNADLSNAQLCSADLSNAQLSGAELITADLHQANLSGSNLHSADLRRANLNNANLSRANLSVAQMRLAGLNHADLSGANLGGANLNGANLNSANLQQSNLRHTDLSGVDLSGADLRGADLSSADLSGANLSGADLSGANLRHASLMITEMHNTNLSGADLGRADLSGADLSGTNLSDANVARARFQSNSGLSEEGKQSLKRRGAIFEDEKRNHLNDVHP